MEAQIPTVDSEVLKELECPVCMEYMLPPIRLCENGHNICKNCLPKMQSCPTCRGNFIQARNVALENLATSHQENLPETNRLRCPFAAISRVKCSWKGVLHEIKNHVTERHRDECVAANGERPFVMKLANFTSTKYYIKRNHYRRIIMTMDELFYIVCKIEGTHLCCVVMYIGPEEKTSNFRYRFTILKDGGKEIISLCSAVRNYMIKLDHILELGLCVKLDYRTAWNFLDSRNTLVFEIEIYDIRKGTLQLFTRNGETGFSFVQWVSHFARRAFCVGWSLRECTQISRRVCCCNRWPRCNT